MRILSGTASSSVGRVPRSARHWWLLSGTAVVVLLHAGQAAASIPDANGLFHACYQKSSGGMRIIDTAVDSCRNTETEVTWSQKGPAGQPGAPGQAGPSDAYVKDQKGSF